jgi:hypothetical protein
VKISGNFPSLYRSLYRPGLLRTIAPRYRYWIGAIFTVAVAPLLLVEKNGDGSATTFSPDFLTLRATAIFDHRQFIFWVSIMDLHRYLSQSTCLRTQSNYYVFVCELFILRPAGDNIIVDE